MVDAAAGRRGLALPDFPWDALVPFAQQAAAHPDGVIDLSVGTPVDPTPEVIQQALAAATNAPGYPTTQGTVQLREAIVQWFERRRGVPGLDVTNALPSIGSKELVAWLPQLLGLGTGDAVLFPQAAYPTYDIGTRIAGALPLAVDLATSGEGDDVAAALDAVAVQAASHGAVLRLIWINSPSNPTGAVADVAHLRSIVDWARQHGVVVASDECYAELPWHGAAVPSVLDPAVCGGDFSGLLSVYSLSKQSNLAGYRAAFVAGDAALLNEILQVRKHAGMIMPMPVQTAMVAALTDDAHVQAQKAVYARRREVVRSALTGAGFRIDASEAGLYLWSTRGEAAMDTVAWLAARGVLVAPGSFYGPAGVQHVRVALTATDSKIDSLPSRFL